MVFFASIVILIILGRGAVATYLKEKQSKVLAANAKERLEVLKNREQDLNQKIDFLSTDEGKEMELRSVYNAAKPGESAVLIVDNKNATATPKVKKTFWQKFRDLF